MHFDIIYNLLICILGTSCFDTDFVSQSTLTKTAINSLLHLNSNCDTTWSLVTSRIFSINARRFVPYIIAGFSWRQLSCTRRSFFASCLDCCTFCWSPVCTCLWSFTRWPTYTWWTGEPGKSKQLLPHRSVSGDLQNYLLGLILVFSNSEV